jgi:LysR family transcriptional activator of nhaA
LESYRWERINLNHLWYFYVAAEERSVKAASEKLFVSQPTISDQIKLLEEYLECKLFERRNRAIFLTKEGELALEYARTIFDLSREMVKTLRHKEKLPRDSLVIGLTPFMSEFFHYEQLLPIFDQELLTIQIVEEERHLLLAELEEENVDMIFTTTNMGLSSQVKSSRIGINKTFAIAHKKFKKYQKGFPEKLDEIPYFGHSPVSSLRYEIELFFSKHGLTPRMIGEGADIHLFELVTQAGKGFMIVPEVALNRLQKNKDIKVLGEIGELQTSVYAITRKNLSPLQDQVLTSLS